MSRGHDRERKIRSQMEADGWLVIRAAGSLGLVDLVALRRLNGKSEAWLIEVKSTAGGPYERFGPEDREALKAAADKAGAEAWLFWWPPRRQLHMIPASEWPAPRTSEE